MPDQTRRDYYERRRGAMELERSSFLSHYKELAEFVQPRRQRLFLGEVNQGTKRHNSIINSTATRAHAIARAGMLAGTMSPARPWFSLETPDRDMMEFAPVRVWLDRVEEIIRAILNESNFYNMAPLLIGDALLFATAFMTHDDDFENVARFYSLPVGSYLVAQNERLEVDTLCREYEMTVYQMVREFGLKNVSETIRGQYDRGNYDAMYPVVHFVDPNPEMRADNPFARGMRWRSVKYEKGGANGDKFLSERGFREFPGYALRWDVTGEDVYGTDCPGMTALGDIRGLQLEERRRAQAIDKMVNPPLKGPASLRNIQVTSLPGGVNVYDADESRGKLEPLYQVAPQVQELSEDIRRVEARINSAFYVDMFLAISTMEGIQPRNELDLIQRNEERLLQLGPVLERLRGDFHNRLIDRLFYQAVRARILPSAPSELSGVTLKVKYISTLALAQRAVATGTIDRLTAYAGHLAGLGFAEALDKIDAAQAVDEYANAIGAPPRLVVPDEIVERRMRARQQQQQMAQAVQAAQAGANVAKMASDAKTSEPSVLTQMSAAIANRVRGNR